MYEKDINVEILNNAINETYLITEEGLQRLKERDWYNIDTDRKIKPIFVNIDITEIVGGR